MSNSALIDLRCKNECATFGACKGKTWSDGCLGFKPIGSVKVVSESNVFTSRNIKVRGNGSICDDCQRELDGVCKLHWRVHLSSVKQCDDFIKR